MTEERRKLRREIDRIRGEYSSNRDGDGESSSSEKDENEKEGRKGEEKDEA